MIEVYQSEVKNVMTRIALVILTEKNDLQFNFGVDAILNFIVRDEN